FCGEKAWRISDSVLHCIWILSEQQLDELDPSETRERTGVGWIYRHWLNCKLCSVSTGPVLNHQRHQQKHAVFR
ncbi:hypothetical protein M9458_006038, partial [Cirrhinus mrigala]